MIYWQIFVAFFIPGILGYGGGPSSIPLIEKEVVERYGWLTVSEFSEALAVGNALPGPISTKMAGYIGFEMGGYFGAAIALFATIAPSMILMLLLLGILMRHRESDKVKRLTNYVRPAIAVMLGALTFDFIDLSVSDVGIVQTLIIGVISLYLMERRRVHPVYVICGAIVYGALFL